MIDIQSPAGRVWAALYGYDGVKTPFTIYELFMSQSETERKLRNQGLCIARRVNSYDIEYKGINRKKIVYTDSGREVVKTIYDTPFGELSYTQEELGSSYWTREFLFKSPDDYKKLLCLIRSMTAIPCYDKAAAIINETGDDFVILDNMPLEPLQHFISSEVMDMSDFCYEWYDNRDELLKLYEAFVEFNRSTYQIVADGPMKLANYGGNVIPQIIGREVFKDLYLPHYEEAAEILHKAGKLIGCHYDDDNTIIMDMIAETSLDYIEAYDCGVSPPISEAIKCFGNKALWITWPCKWHHAGFDESAAYTEELLREANGFNKLLFGITEDIPPYNFYPVMNGIMQGIENFHK